MKRLRGVILQEKFDRHADYKSLEIWLKYANIVHPPYTGESFVRVCLHYQLLQQE